MRYVEACEHGNWHLMLTDECIEDAFAVPYKCRSWRHPGDCCRWKGAQDFARVKQAIERFCNWSYLVLTFKQSEWWDWKEQYTLSCSMWSALRCRLRRKYGYFGYIQTWERHKKQGIHVNLLVTSDEMFASVSGNAMAFQRDILRPHACACGFGPRTWAEALRTGTSAGMAGYLTKLSRELVGADQKGQIPFDAPPHFRRLRASRGILPPVHKSNMSGWLVMAPMSENGN